jgi:hypothetical protein
MSQISISDRIQRFLDRKYRISKSYRTVHTYRNNIKRFENFANESSNIDINHLIDRKESKLRAKLRKKHQKRTNQDTSEEHQRV